MDDKTKECLDKFFEFTLGEIVYSRAAEDTIIGVDEPAAGVITERRLQQCSGGLQASYVVRGVVCQEIELTPEKPAGRKMTEVEFDAFALAEGSRRVSSWASLSQSMDAARKSKEKAKEDVTGTV